MASLTSSPIDGSKPSNPQILKKKKRKENLTKYTEIRSSLKHFEDASHTTTTDDNNQWNERRRSLARSSLKLDLPFKRTETTS